MNKKKIAFFSALISLCFAVHAGENFVPGKVIADNLNVRVKPGLKSASVCKIKENTEVRITRVMEGWLEIQAPETLTVFVSASRIGSSGKTTGELNMRAAMDAQSALLGVIPKGTPVEKISEVKHGWVQIKKPANVDIRLYVAGFLVKYDSAKFDADGKIIGSAPATADLDQSKSADSIPEGAAPEKKDVPAVEEVKVPEKAAASEKIESTGFLSKYKFSSDPQTDYVLLTAPDGYNKGFVCCDYPAKISAALNKNVKVTGTSVGRYGKNGAVIIKAESIIVL